MLFKYKSKQLLRVICIVEAILLPALLLVWWVLGDAGAAYDFRVLDAFYAQAVKRGYGPPLSPHIAYVSITDDTYATFGDHSLDRRAMAQINTTLAQLQVAAVAYDIIFARPSPNAGDDQLLTTSLETLHQAYLPFALDPVPQARAFQWQQGPAYQRLRTQYLSRPHVQGRGQPFSAARAFMQHDPFAVATFNSGYISYTKDPDGVARHLPLLMQIDSAYVPTLALAMFLDAVKVPLAQLRVDWGRSVTIPVVPGSTLTKPVRIPIDTYGRVFVPYPQVWNHDFPNMTAHKFLQYSEQPEVRGNLQEFFEGKFVFIGDVSTGITDAGDTPLEKNVPLVVMHTALLNALLTHTFYQEWPLWQMLALVCLLGAVLGLAALPKASWVLYLVGGLIVLGLVALTWVQCLAWTFFPIVRVGSSVVVLFGGIVIGLQLAVAKDQEFIRNTFAKYVSEKVVNELLQHRELLQLGGEERVASVLFSDIANFTTLSEQMSPPKLVSLLNEYLTAMTAIVIEEGGIVDKYHGDAIIAEFGVPLHIPKHADLAVRTGVRMQHRLQELRPEWTARGLPELHCRVGINTGSMIVGNIGSAQLLNYTVIGDSVNLAARLEAANKLYKTLVMISEFTYAALSPGLFHTRLLDVIKVKGKAQAVKVYEVYGEAHDTLPPEDVQYYQTYHEAFEDYLARHFDEARAKFTAALALRPDDAAALDLLERLDSLDPHTLPADWDGAVALTTK